MPWFFGGFMLYGVETIHHFGKGFGFVLVDPTSSFAVIYQSILIPVSWIVAFAILALGFRPFYSSAKSIWR